MTAKNREAAEVERAAEGDASSVADLLARRAQLQAWIDALTENADDVPPHVVERVRADYQSRLATVVEHLSEHRDSLEADAERLREQLHSVRAERESTSDRLAEGRLRNRLGEWRDDEWQERRAELEEALTLLQEQEEESGAELARLEELLRSIGASRSVPEPRAPEPVVPPARQVEASDLFSVPAPAPASAADEPAEVPSQAALAEDSPSDTRPGSGVKCPECGYTNDSAAWYCGVCGVDLA